MTPKEYAIVFVIALVTVAVAPKLFGFLKGIGKKAGV